MADRTSPAVTRADRRLGLRLLASLVGTLVLGAVFLLLALLVRGNWQPLIRLDTAVADRMNAVARSSDALVWVLKALGRVTDPNVFRLAAIVLAVWLIRRRRYRLAAWTLVTSLVGGLLSPLLKLVVERARPALDDPVARAGGLSFPSGHATGSMIGIGVLLLVFTPLLPQRWRRVGWAVGVLGLLVVGLDRITLGVHYLSDVVAGWVIGLGWLVLTSAAFETWRRDVGLPPSPPLETEPEVGESVPERRTG